MNLLKTTITTSIGLITYIQIAPEFLINSDEQIPVNSEIINSEDIKELPIPMDDLLYYLSKDPEIRIAVNINDGIESNWKML